MSIEGWKSFFDIGTLVLLFLVFAFGAGVWFTGDVINKRQSVQLRQFDKDLTGAKTDLAVQQGKTSAAESDLIKLKTALADAQKDADVARLALERQVAKQDRRSNLFRDLKLTAAFMAQVSEYAGQRVDIRTCPTPISDTEMVFLQLALAGKLLQANWEIIDIQTPLFGCSEGIFVNIDPRAPDSTKKAAEALVKALGGMGLYPPGSSFGLTAGKQSDEKTRYLETSSVDAILIGIQAHP